MNKSVSTLHQLLYLLILDLQHVHLSYREENFLLAVIDENYIKIWISSNFFPFESFLFTSFPNFPCSSYPFEWNY